MFTNEIERLRIEYILNSSPYNIIYADCPWTYRVWNKKGAGRTAIHHYDVLTLEDLMRLNVKKIASDDCALFLWATYPTLPEALKVMESWGFTYKTVAFTWVKTNMKNDNFFTGMGSWTRANPEVVLFGTRGRPIRLAKDVPNLVVSKRRSHSAKPPEIRYLIERLLGMLPRIELFARDPVQGWMQTGLEFDGLDIRSVL